MCADAATAAACAAPDLDERSAPTPTAALEPAANGNAAAAADANGTSEAAAAAADKAAAAEAEAAAEAAEAASFFVRGAEEQPLTYAVRVFERVYGHDIDKVLTMEVRLAIGQTLGLDWCLEILGPLC